MRTEMDRSFYHFLIEIEMDNSSKYMYQKKFQKIGMILNTID